MSQDVDSLAVLSEAVIDNDFMQEMQNNGIKGFKRAAFKNKLVGAITTYSHSNNLLCMDGPATAMAAYQVALEEYLSRVKIPRETFLKVNLYAPEQLQCSISMVLMVVDPVVATGKLHHDMNVFVCLFDYSLL